MACSNCSTIHLYSTEKIECLHRKNESNFKTDTFAELINKVIKDILLMEIYIYSDLINFNYT